MSTKANVVNIKEKKVSAKAKQVAGMRRRNGYYHLPEGRKYISVTTVLDSLAKPALVGWAAKTAAKLVLEDPYTYDTEKAAAGGIYKTSEKAMDRGSMVHSFIEALMGGADMDLSDLPEKVQGYGKSFLGWAAMAKPQLLYSEATVYSDTHQYAGTLDLIALLSDGQIWTLDAKTGKGVYPEAGLQLSAYRNAERLITAEGEHVELPECDQAGVILVNEKGHAATLTPMDDDFEVFLALKKVALWEKGIK